MRFSENISSNKIFNDTRRNNCMPKYNADNLKHMEIQINDLN